MLKSYTSIAVRNILREKFYSLLNVTGLAIGIACFILISLWIKDELSYDRHFKNYDRIHRIETSLVTEGVPQPMVTTDRRLIGLLQERYRHVCEAVSIYKTPALLSWQRRTSYQEQTFYADANFFKVFSFGFLYGDPNTALQKEGSVVISESVARKLFGSRNPVGDTVRVNNLKTKDNTQVFVVTGVIRDNKRTSHFHPAAIFRKMEIMDTFEMVYILLREGYTATYFAEQIWKPLYEKYFRPNYIYERQDIWLDRVQPIADIHLAGTKWEDLEPNGDRFLIYVFAAIGLLILSLACINYINLATARSFNRSREIGVRKVLGAHRKQIIAQFLIEAIITSLIALLVGLSLAEMAAPLFGQLADKEIDLDLLDPAFLAFALLLAVVIGILSGAYPAFFISSFLPVMALKGVQPGAGSKPTLRKSLVVIQFAITISMLIATIVIARQLRFLKRENLGFDTTRMLVVSLDDEKVNKEQAAVKADLLKNSNILKVSMSHNIPGNEINHTYISFETPKGMHGHLINSMFVDQYYLKAMDLKLIQGRDFDSSMISRLDTNAFIIINESAAKFLKYDKPVGKKINTGAHYGLRTGEIIGVVRDFHASSLHQPIGPLVLALGTLGRPEGKSKFLTIKLRSENIDSTIAFIEKTYMSYGQGYPFQYSFLDQVFNDQYKKEEKQRILFDWFAALSIFSSFLGLVGLASFFIRQRAKEICIRRLSGAATYHIIRTLSFDFVRLTIIAWLIAAPIAYWAMSKWLGMFAYHISISLPVLVIPGLATLLLVFSTITLHALVAVRRSPAKVLRYE
jgi:putative ABC transport system permease protein